MISTCHYYLLLGKRVCRCAGVGTPVFLWDAALREWERCERITLAFLHASDSTHVEHVAEDDPRVLKLVK